MFGGTDSFGNSVSEAQLHEVHAQYVAFAEELLTDLVSKQAATTARAKSRESSMPPFPLEYTACKEFEIFKTVS